MVHQQKIGATGCYYYVTLLTIYGITLSGQSTHAIHLMEAEVALYWRTLCQHLQDEAQVSE